LTATALTIAGSDSGGGAGIQADLKTFSALGVYGCSVVTAVTAQNTCDVTAVHPIPNHIVAAQIKAVLSDIRVHAIKIGMLGTPELIDCVADCLQRFDGPIVIDPVMVAKSGAELLSADSLDALRQRLLPRAAVLTPNIPEAARLLGTLEQAESNALRDQGRSLLAMGPDAVLMKGGHGTGDICTDWLITSDSEHVFRAPRIDTRNTHGTGCSLSAAIAAGLAKRQSIDAAVATAHAWLQQAIRGADTLAIGHGHGPVHHFFEVWK
jgi:hydroxymethylpyrimidine/phosphomethylpyrimidine kinase